MDIGLHPDSGEGRALVGIYVSPVFPFSLFAARFQVPPLGRIFISAARRDGSPASKPDFTSIEWRATPPVNFVSPVKREFWLVNFPWFLRLRPILLWLCLDFARGILIAWLSPVTDD